MDLNFQRGRADAPAGHALVFFTSAADGNTLATYLVVLPVSLNLSKYIPPMLAAQLPIADFNGMGAIPLPPIPEAVESRPFVERLAELRRDDLIDGGRVNPTDVARAMTLVGDIAQKYARLYESWLARSSGTATEVATTDNVSDVSASDVIYGLMSEQQRLGELAKMASQLRYAVDGGDLRQADDLDADIRRLGQYLPPSYRIDEFVAAARRTGDTGRELATLYLDRCYRLAREDYSDLPRIEREIERLRATK